MIAAFHDAYEIRNGNRFPGFSVQGVTFRAQLVVRTPKVIYEKTETGDGSPPPSSGRIRLRHLAGAEADALEYQGSSLRRGDAINGPAIVREPTSTTYVPPGRTLSVGDFGEMVIR